MHHAHAEHLNTEQRKSQGHKKATSDGPSPALSEGSREKKERKKLSERRHPFLLTGRTWGKIELITGTPFKTIHFREK